MLYASIILALQALSHLMWCDVLISEYIETAEAVGDFPCLCGTFANLGTCYNQKYGPVAMAADEGKRPKLPGKFV